MTSFKININQRIYFLNPKTKFFLKERWKVAYSLEKAKILSKYMQTIVIFSLRQAALGKKSPKHCFSFILIFICSKSVKTNGIKYKYIAFLVPCNVEEGEFWQVFFFL